MSDQRRPPLPGGSDAGGMGDNGRLLEAELGKLARDLTAEDMNLLDPPPDLWAAIAQAIAEPGAGSPTPVGSPLHDLTSRRARRAKAEKPRAASRFSPRSARIAAAAAIAAVLAGGAIVVNATRDDPAQLLAQTEITNDGLPVAFAETGTATVMRDGSDLYLALDIPALPATTTTDAYYEVWMIDTDVDGMVSLGVVSPDGRLDLPDELDPQAFPIVDISVEPLDGDPTHSGQSILRGVLH